MVGLFPSSSHLFLLLGTVVPRNKSSDQSVRMMAHNRMVGERTRMALDGHDISFTVVQSTIPIHRLLLCVHYALSKHP